MSGRTVSACCLVACLVSAAAGEEGAAPSAATARPAERTPHEAIARALQLADLVLERHVTPPTRQEMILQGALRLYGAAGIPAPAGLARRVSESTSAEVHRELLAAAWTAAAASLPVKTIEEELLAGVLAAAPGSVRLLPTKEFRVEEQLQANRYVGIGIALKPHESSGFTQIATLFAGGPAARTGAEQGDLIESIDGRSTKGVVLTEVVDRLRGPEGSPVTVVVRQPDAASARTLEITRGVVPRRTVFGWKQDEPDQFIVARGIAGVRLTEIGGSVVHELRQVEEQLQARQDLQALVIDLRDCDGARSAHSAAMFADALLSEGVIGRVRKADRVQELTADPECLFRGWPLAVLVDETVGNGAEWVAASLQDNRRALVVGQPTGGRAYVSGGIELPGEESALVLPEGILERPSGKRLLRQRTDAELTEQRPSWQDGARQPSWWNRGVWPDHVVAPRDAAMQRSLLTLARKAPDGLAVPAPPAVPGDAALSKACELLSAQWKNRTERPAQ